MSGPTTCTGTGIRRLRLDIGYDGTDFHGWAIQPGMRTVEGVITEWMNRILPGAGGTRLIVAGRTDAGVHARGQVAHVDLPCTIDPGELSARLAKVLPPDIVVSRVSRAPEGFDARFAAVWRRYVYRLWDAASLPDPLLRREVVTVPGALDIERMVRAGQELLGLHNFVAFAKRREHATTVRTLLECHVRRNTDRAGTIELTVRADAFCRSMVRSLAGALVAIGLSRQRPEWIGQLLSRTRRDGAITVMPAAGLCLEEVGYPPDGQLALRASQSRATRTLDRVAEATTLPMEVLDQTGQS